MFWVVGEIMWGTVLGVVECVQPRKTQNNKSPGEGNTHFTGPPLTSWVAQHFHPVGQAQGFCDTRRNFTLSKEQVIVKTVVSQKCLRVPQARRASLPF